MIRSRVGLPGSCRRHGRAEGENSQLWESFQQQKGLLCLQYCHRSVSVLFDVCSGCSRSPRHYSELTGIGARWQFHLWPDFSNSNKTKRSLHYTAVPRERENRSSRTRPSTSPYASFPDLRPVPPLTAFIPAPAQTCSAPLAGPQDCESLSRESEAPTGWGQR